MAFNIVQKNDGSTAFVNEDSYTAIRMYKDETVKIAGVTYNATELGYLDGLTPGTVTASKALVVDSSKDLSALRNLTCQNLDAGASGTVGSIDIYPSSSSKGKFTLSCTDQTGDTTVTLNANAMGQGTTVNLADPGAAASYLVQSTAALTLAEVDVLDAVTAGTVTASKALVVDGNKDLSALRNLTCQNLDAGASGTAGSLDLYPSTESKGKVTFSAADNAGDTTTTISFASQADTRTFTVADPGASASFMMSGVTQNETMNPVTWVETTINYDDLSSGSTKTIQSSSGTIQYKVRDIFLSADGTNFSGGGGDRDIAIQDSSGTIVYTVIPAGTAQSLAFARWDSTEIPGPTTASDFLSATTAGEDLVAKYSGGSADYGAGSMKVLVCLEKVAA